MNVPEFSTKKERLAWMIEHKETLIAQKKAETKHADAISYGGNKATPITKAAGDNVDEIQVKTVINTTNLLDSHSDVHLKGIWTKSLKENKMIMHLQEHQMKFDHIIADGDDVKASVKDYSWKELGYDFEGTTQALVFDSTVKLERNPTMFKQYKNGYVNNHSVGMQYVKLLLAVNDEDYGAEFEAWEKYYPEVANKDVADEQGYFWVVKEAKVIEGSAVPLGSNYATPTLEITEPLKDTQQTQPSKDTVTIDEFKNLLKELK